MAVASGWDTIHYTTQPGVFGGYHADYFVKNNAETLDFFFILPGNVYPYGFKHRNEPSKTNKKINCYGYAMDLMSEPHDACIILFLAG